MNRILLQFYLTPGVKKRTLRRLCVLPVVLSFLIASLVLSCRSGGDDKPGNTGDLMSVRTLGLAYLEEFKLEEAEKEFLKFIELAPEDKFGYANLGLTYLRSGDYPEAEKQLRKAISIDSLDADIRLILATVYRMNDETEKAVTELKKSLSFAPGHVKILYEISEIYSARTDDVSVTERREYLRKLIRSAPGNLVPKLNLTEILINIGDTDGALEQLEIIRAQFPDFPKEAGEFYEKTFAALRNNNSKEAILNYTIFHNYLKVTPPYQAGMVDLKGPGGSLIGFPLITFDRKTRVQTSGDASIIDQIKFSEVAGPSGLRSGQTRGSDEFGDYSHVVAADYDGDDDIDLYAAGYDQASSSFVHRLYNNNTGIFTDVASEAGVNHNGRESSAIFGDYDNDGFLDLYVLREEGDILYRNNGTGKFENVTSAANTGSKTGGNMALFFDADHDGDLDLFEARSGMNLLFRNNADGTFRETGEQMNLAGGNSITSDAAFGDFDEDGDIDLFVTNENESNHLYSNQRQGIFRNVAVEQGIQGQPGAGSVTVADYNNDGFLDIFVTSATADHVLYRNTGTGKFETSGNTGDLIRVLKNKKIHDVAFLDFDNDGFTDLFATGENLYLFHNNGKGEFSDVSRLLPQNTGSGRKAAIFDYNDDGDPDIALAGSDGSLFLLRNDGGNNNHHVEIKLVGLRAGSAKNNHFGIGAKVEMRAGDLYQTMVVIDPNIQFGIGDRKMADVIRITWTNGVPQNIFFPEADQALIEAQTLKGSCPFLYAWDGEKFEFVKDILWRSGLGMPLGIMGGTTAYAFADASDDYLKIPGESMKPAGGKYTIQVTSELWETIYLDKISFVAVDHPASTSVWVEEQFTPPPFPGMKIFHVEEEIIPVSAIDSYGTDVLQYIKAKDDKYLPGFITDKYQGITEMMDIVLDPGSIGNDNGLILYMNGWIFPTDASINVAISQTDKIKVVPPQIQVLNGQGEWVTVIDGIGFPMGKDKTVIADLSGKFLTGDHRVRIRTNMQIYWDYIFFSGKQSTQPLITTKMDPAFADLHYRGFSKDFRKGSRYGPHWFDYQEVSTGVRWRDLSGNYTRFGDVFPLLTAADNKYVITNAGDEVTIEFDALSLPKLKPGWKRDFLVNSVGWVKDGDINTAFGNTVHPLPFHGMKSYPPSPEDNYPADPGLQKYNEEYNTRMVTGDKYLNALKK